MKAAFHVVLLSALFVVLAGNSGSCGGSRADTVAFTILHTNDIHSHVHEAKAGTELNPFNLGGLARIKTLADRIRAAKPNVLMLDAGDWSEGTMPFTNDAGVNMLRFMDAMGYNAVVVGNHDFLNGPTQLAATIEMAKPSFPVLGANKNLNGMPETDRDRLSRAVQDYAILKAGDVRVAVIGLLTEDIDYRAYFQPADITNSIERASQISTYLHDNNLADVIVLLSHNKFGENVRFAKAVPWVNVVVSGHSHMKTPQPVIVSNAGQPVYVVETKHWGQFLGELNLIYNKKTHQVTMAEYFLIPVTHDTPEEPRVAAMVSADDQALSTKWGRDVNTRMADCSDEIVHADGREVPLSNMLADAYREVTGAQIAVESVMLTGQGVGAGPVSFADLFNMAPHIYGPIPGQSFPAVGKTFTLKVLTVTGADLRKLYNVIFFGNSKGVPIGWISLSGARITYHAPTTPFDAIEAFDIFNPVTNQYEPFDVSADYTIAMHDGLILGIKTILPILEAFGLTIDISRMRETNIQTWQATTAHVLGHGGINVADYEPGKRYHPRSGDIGFYEHNIKLEQASTGPTISVTVQNEGLTATGPGYGIRVLRSEPNDMIHDSTWQEITPITSVDAAIPPLAPGEKTTVMLPWNDLPGPGIYSLHVFMTGGGDGNGLNNDVTIHRTIK